MSYQPSFTRRGVLQSTAISASPLSVGGQFQQLVGNLTGSSAVSIEQIDENEVTCASFLQNKGFGVNPQWMSNWCKICWLCNKLANYACFEHFVDHVVTESSTPFDVVTGMNRYPPLDSKKLSLLSIPMIFYPFSDAQLAQDWQSKFSEIASGLTRIMDESTTERTDQQRSRSIIGKGLTRQAAQLRDHSETVLFQVTPIGIIWMSIPSKKDEVTINEKDITVRKLLEQSRDTIARVHGQLHEAGELFAPPSSRFADESMFTEIRHRQTRRERMVDSLIEWNESYEYEPRERRSYESDTNGCDSNVDAEDRNPEDEIKEALID